MTAGLARAVGTVVTRCLRVRPGEEVVVAGDESSRELGVGTNGRARPGGNVIEDEKILGSVHVAFGASAGIGGTVSVPVHLDVAVADATLDVGGTRVLEHGAWVL